LFQLFEDQSTYIPLGEVYRLENAEDIPMEVIGIQIEDYLGEDDYERS
jgi:mannose-6-phosphate isomerase-like protein (cupin superfamily)